MKRHGTKLLLAALLLVSSIKGHAAIIYRVTDLGTFPGGVVTSNSISSGNAINSVGQIAAGGTAPGGFSHASLYSGGAMIDLGTLGGNQSSARAINAAGQVAGDADLSTGNY